MSFLSALFGSGPSAKQFPTMGKNQQALQDQIIKLIGPQLSQLLNPSAAVSGGQKFLEDLYKPGSEGQKSFEAPYLRQFNEEIIPGISERFAGLGGLNSSGFQQSLGQAGAGLSEKLASLRTGTQLQGLGAAQQYGQQPFNNLMSLLQTALAPQFSTGVNPGGPGALSQLLGPIAGGFGNVFGQNLGQRFSNF